MKRKVTILSIKFDRISLKAAVRKIEKWLEKGKCYQVGTLNPEYVVRAQEDRRLREAISQMKLIVPDGVGIIWAAKAKKLGRLERIRGGDLVEKLAELCAEKGYKLALIGGGLDVAQIALLALQKRFPHLKGWATQGPVNLKKETKQQRRRMMIKIRKTKPRILLTSFGFLGPIWIDELLKDLRKKGVSLVALEVGGVFNYLSGRTKIPPEIIRKIGLEWLWRLFWQPWRLKRQVALLKFLWLFFCLDS